MKTTLNATCSSCGKTHEITAYSGINVAENPELKSMVKDGSLFVWECPVCGKANLATYQTLYHDPEEKLMIWMLPEGILPEDRVEAIGKQMESSADLPDGYVFRRTLDIGSLIEKVNIFDAGLDDRVIEMCKYVTRMEMAEKNEDQDIPEASLKFYKMNGPDNDLEFSYPKDGKMLGIRTSFNIYGDCAGILRRNLSIKTSGGFPIVDQTWVARFFR